MPFRVGPSCDCCDVAVDCCEIPGTIYFWYRHVESVSPLVTTLVGPIAVPFDVPLGAWITSMPVAIQNYDGTEGLYDSELYIALKPRSLPCRLWQHHAMFGFGYTPPYAFCRGVFKPGAEGTPWVATAAGDPLDVVGPLSEYPCGSTPGYWVHGYAQKIYDCGEVIATPLDSVTNYAFTRTTDEPAI